MLTLSRLNGFNVAVPDLFPQRLSNLDAWVDAKAPGTLIDADVAGQLSTWRDRSGNDNDLTQTTSGDQPNIGDGVINFDGSEFVQNLSLTAANDTLNIFIVGEIDGTTVNDRRVWSWTNSADFNDTSKWVGNYNTPVARLQNFAQFTNMASNTTSDTYADDTKQVWHWELASGADEIYVSNTAGTGGTAPATITNASFVLFGGNSNAGAIGDVYEVIYIVGDLTGSTRTAVHDWLANKHGL